MPDADLAFLRIDAVSKSFGDVRAVDQVSLDVARGEIFALLGSSGCGKSTLLRLLAGFEAPSAGRIVLGGVDLAGRPPYERPVNMMFQSYALFPHLSVWDNVAFGPRRDGLSKEEVGARVEEKLRLVQMTALGRRKPHQLSGGQQQRVALARSLAKRPQLLLLDEPLAALDKKLREATRVELIQIIAEVGVTCLVVTHDQDEAMTMATRMAVMSEGRLVQVGNPADIYETPNSRFVADFIGNVNLMEGTVEALADRHVDIRCADVVHRLDAGIDSHRGHSVTVALRPEKIDLCREASGEDAVDVNQVQGIVRDRAYFGGHTVYRLELASGAPLAVSIENDTRALGAAPALGDTVWARWPAGAQVMLTR
ncbi:MAG: ABC transporter ATP-binding protein [Variovorax sp.]